MISSANQRPVRPTASPEIESLLGFIDYLRETLALKCEGLSDEQLHTAATSSAITLGGLFSHLARVEDWWCTTVVGNEPVPAHWETAERSNDPDWDWKIARQHSGVELRAFWQKRVAASKEVIAKALAAHPDALDQLHRRPDTGDEFSLRWVLLHLIEEYARHCGHADLIRESLDGTVGV